MQPKFSIEYKSVLVTFEANKHCTTLKSYPSIIVRILSHSISVPLKLGRS